MGMDGYGMGMGGGWNNWGWDGGWAGALVVALLLGVQRWMNWIFLAEGMKGGGCLEPQDIKFQEMPCFFCFALTQHRLKNLLSSSKSSN